MSIGNKIKERRLCNKLSQLELSKLTSIPQTTISDWENEKSIPNTRMLTKICKALDIKIEEIIDEEDENE